MKEVLESKLQKAVSELLENFDGDTKVEIPSHKDHGDFSSNIAMKLAGNLRNNPLNIAESIVSLLGKIEGIKSIEVVKPGFINFFVDKEVIVKDILEKALLGTIVDEIKKDKKVIIEHTSVNPNKSMHVGHLRNAILGDVLSNVYRKLGYAVEVQNYIDDTGLQVADTTNAVMNLDIKRPENQAFDDYCWDIYTEINKQYEQNEELIEKRKHISEQIEEGGNPIAEKSEEIVHNIVDCHLDLMSQFNIFYDLLVYESDIIRFGFWEQAFKQLQKSPNFFLETEGKQKGCWVLKYDEKKFGNKIFVRSNGTKVYTAKDTAYQLWKFGTLKKDFKYSLWPRKFNEHEVSKTDTKGIQSSKFGKGDIVINLIDERQTYPQEMVKHALNSLGYKEQYDNYEHLAYGVVSLSPSTASIIGIDTSDGKNAYAMSGRKGIGVKVTKLLEIMIDKIKKSRDENNSPQTNMDSIAESIAIGAIKHYMLKYVASSEINFDYEEALRLTGNTGPYLQYSYVRASSILEKVATNNIPKLKLPAQISESEKDLVLVMGQWKDTLEKIAENNYTSHLADFAFKLASTFHTFYEKNNVINSDPVTRDFRINIILAFKNVIGDVLETMGIATPRQM